jgi:hypothetical protein
MERPLCTPVRKPRIDSSPVRPAGSDDEIDPSALFEQVYVDPDLLRGNVRAALRRRLRIGLADLIIEELLVHGQAELVTYLSLSLAVGKASPYARSSSTGSAGGRFPSAASSLDWRDAATDWTATSSAESSAPFPGRCRG